jgi:hypothetical protein
MKSEYFGELLCCYFSFSRNIIHIKAVNFTKILPYRISGHWMIGVLFLPHKFAHW